MCASDRNEARGCFSNRGGSSKRMSSPRYARLAAEGAWDPRSRGAAADDIVDDRAEELASGLHVVLPANRPSAEPVGEGVGNLGRQAVDEIDGARIVSDAAPAMLDQLLVLDRYGL